VRCFCIDLTHLDRAVSFGTRPDSVRSSQPESGSILIEKSENILKTIFLKKKIQNFGKKNQKSQTCTSKI